MTPTPPVRRGLDAIDKSLFTTTLDVHGVRLLAPDSAKFTKGPLAKHVLWLPRVTPIVSDPSSSQYRIVLITEEAKDSTEMQDFVKQHEGYKIVQQQVSLDYDYWTAGGWQKRARWSDDSPLVYFISYHADQILQAILPETLLDESPTSFTQVGHIAHLNLRDEYLPYRHLIGQVILDKNKTVKTVVNKLDTIDNEFRFFKMEVLAGVEDFIVHTAESGCSFTFDFSKVYWNSRLSTEHGKLVDMFTTDDVVCDSFAGVGPFAVPAGKKGCAVMASDLNPESAKALAENVKINKASQKCRHRESPNGRDWIRQSVLDVWRTPFDAFSPPLTAREQKKLQRQRNEAKRLAAEQAASGRASSSAVGEAASGLDQLSIAEKATAPTSGPPRRLIDHFVMNLPASAIEFLDAYRGLYVPLYEMDPSARDAVSERGYDKLPMVHCYCFTKDVEHAEQDICERASRSLGLPVTPQTPGFNLRFVRDVAPKKEMYCLEFRLTRDMVEWTVMASTDARRPPSIDSQIDEWLASVYPCALESLRRARIDSAATRERAFVTLTYAQSLDGKISGKNGRQLRLSCDESMRVTHALRRIHDSIMVGIGTVLNDDPQLSGTSQITHRDRTPLTMSKRAPAARIPEMLPVELQPRPIVLDSQLRTPETAKLVINGQRQTMPRPTVFCLDDMSSVQQAAAKLTTKECLEKLGVTVKECSGSDGNLNLEQVLSSTSLGSSVMIEGGAKVISNVLAQGLSDLVIVTISPQIVGDGVSAYSDTHTYPPMKHVASKQFGVDTIMVFRRI
ncbi:tRNA(m(1)G37)methyltransferase [Microbotryomycetes sp. JL201]|nr:tRNA(m(1)G37)methyltransferase [Microbotryomycetes sp. JL201]